MTMSDISDMIQINRSDTERPDCIEYRAVLNLEAVGFISKELAYSDRLGSDAVYDGLVMRLRKEILCIVYREVVAKLHDLRMELYREARTAGFEGYTAKIEMAEKIDKLINDIRYGG